MPTKNFLLSLCLLFSAALPAQLTWSGDIAAIMYKNCTSCHNPNGIAPFSLIDYNSANAMAYSIAGAVQSGRMPPWMADTAYQRFAHERILTTTEKTKILDWVNNNAPAGNLSQAPAPPYYAPDGELGVPDLEVKMPVYTSKATSIKDDYICIALPSGLNKTRKIKAVEVIPGNRKIVHHVLVFLDPTGTYQSDTVGGDCGGPAVGFMVTGYAPGGQPTVFPNGQKLKTGITMTANANVILAMHYPEGSAGEKDSTKVRFYFYDENETGIREIKTNRLLENWNFCIDANKVQSVDDWYPSASVGVSKSYSLLSIFPHMHLLGKSIKAYGLGPSDDTLPLINIPHWDFEWQDFYYFKHLQKLPQNYRLFGKGIYDNRSTNTHNPNQPPKRICAGLNTSDEMFLFYFHYLDYQPGDENINVENLMQIGLPEQHSAEANEVMVFPNPASEEVNLSYHLQNRAFVNLFIYDRKGKLVEKLISESQEGGEQQVSWRCKALPAGLYFYSLKVDETVSKGKIVIK